MEDLQRFEKLKQEAMETIDNGMSKKKGCKSCKKKKTEITKLPELVEFVLPPVTEELLEVYHLMQLMRISDEEKLKINRVYKSIFNEDIDFNCRGCGGRSFRKYQHYIKSVLKLNVK